MEFFLSYLLFLAKIVTFIFSITILYIFFTFSREKIRNQKGNLKITDLNKIYQNYYNLMKQAKMTKKEYKKWIKLDKKNKKTKKKDNVKNKFFKKRFCLFVINFFGNVNAEEVRSLKEEITAILLVAEKGDRVLLRLESFGGTVNGYGLAAFQLNRLREKGIKLIVSIDKVAASGGYMMASVANKIIAAPFSVIGSIGVIAQIPNMYKFLKNKDIDVEMHTAGEYKRTLTMFGENTETGRKKFLEELNETHKLFKDFVKKNRPEVEIDSVSTGECWYGIQAIENKLIDELSVSDEIIMKNIKSFKIIEVSYIKNKKPIKRLFWMFSKILKKFPYINYLKNNLL
ncbi:peptidase [Candidatus Riesia sp. GBBU]|nr:peptidase [Candidatus Riesia sp. GBBU]